MPLVEGNGVLYTSPYPGGYWPAPLSNPTQWTQITAPTANGGAWLIRYDPDHDILYATGHAAFWRVRMK